MAGVLASAEARMGQGPHNAGVRGAGGSVGWGRRGAGTQGKDVGARPMRHVRRKGVVLGYLF